MLDLTAWIETRLDSDDALTDDVQLLIVAALEGDAALADVANYQPPARQRALENDAQPEPSGAFLKQIRVQGFRGIGEQAQLDFRPTPGLTVIAGRNGSGKSSFAEALEFALLGTTARWQERRGAAWDGAWRNLHDGDPASIEVTLTEEHVGQTKIGVAWEAEAARDAHTTFLQRPGQKREAGLASLGWDAPLATYRPLLTYDELGAILTSEPSKLYDKLANVLGLEQLAGAVKRLEAHAKQLSLPEKEATDRKRSAVGALESIADDDERAQAARAALRKRDPDLASLRAIATGVSESTDRSGDPLHAVLGLHLPSSGEVNEAVARLRTATEQAAIVGDDASTALELRVNLLTTALKLHDHDGDSPCPVCAVGRVDGEWAALARSEIDGAEVKVANLRAATDSLRRARTDAERLVQAVPSAFDHLDVGELGDLAALAREAWTEWATLPASHLDLADHLTTRHPDVALALAELQRAAKQVADARDDEWVAAATRLSAYVEAQERWNAQKVDAASAKHAVKWLKDHDSVLKNERLAPIAVQAKEIWSYLRQESNVEISKLKLDSTNTRRHVVIEASVDDTDAAGLTVLSQGELHALALALFLPRATLPESPFRFVVLDDPVQAMDPAKVDGLVRVLGRIAETRQVIVFSHDDRFAAAVRRAHLNAQILEVTRESGSRVRVDVAFDPPQRYLRDAAALVRDDEVPDDVLRKVLPGLLRFAVEAQARDRYFTEALSTGTPHADIETTWTDTKKTSQRISLALYGEVRSLDGWIDKRSHYRKAGVGVATSAAHSQLNGDPRNALEAVGRIVEDIRNGVR
ncbi:AAA family ATPase [Agromyces bracchium]|uniref:Nuclease SbcCD subunit C n=1 Tax=Agromyces bracchium TaxID=88376 RepID=A0A6I3MDN6_9MICO|nr:AAA family ATPase [Agromyces bracchium]MTH70097.1 AAA family ATPase [Agromyces bracchium]